MYGFPQVTVPPALCLGYVLSRDAQQRWMELEGSEGRWMERGWTSQKAGRGRNVRFPQRLHATRRSRAGTEFTNIATFMI